MTLDHYSHPNREIAFLPFPIPTYIRFEGAKPPEEKKEGPPYLFIIVARKFRRGLNYWATLGHTKEALLPPIRRRNTQWNDGFFS